MKETADPVWKSVTMSDLVHGFSAEVFLFGNAVSQWIIDSFTNSTNFNDVCFQHWRRPMSLIRSRRSTSHTVSPRMFGFHTANMIYSRHYFTKGLFRWSNRTKIIPPNFHWIILNLHYYFLVAQIQVTIYHVDCFGEFVPSFSTTHLSASSPLFFIGSRFFMIKALSLILRLEVYRSSVVVFVIVVNFYNLCRTVISLKMSTFHKHYYSLLAVVKLTST